MNSFQANDSINCSVKSLIDWGTPEMVAKPATYEVSTDNPFDIMELKAATMNPFDEMEMKAANMDPFGGTETKTDTMDPFGLIPNKTPSRIDPPCGNILSPLWKLEVEQKSMPSSVDNADDIVANQSKHNTVNNHSKDDIVESQSKGNIVDIQSKNKIVEDNLKNCTLEDNQSKNHVIDNSRDDHAMMCVNVKTDGDQLNGNHVPLYTSENQEQKNEYVLTPNLDDLVRVSRCNEEEKKKIREETRLRIQMLIENGKKQSQEKYTDHSIFCTPGRNSSLNKTESFLNKGFLRSCSLSDINSNTSVSKSSDRMIDTNDNKSNCSSEFFNNELNAFDLNSLKPEWVVDNFSDVEKSVEIKADISSIMVESNSDSSQVDVKLKALSRIGIESKLNGCQTFVKSIQNKRIPSKGPFVANVPLEQMVQNYKNEEIMAVPNESDNTQLLMKPVASSTPTLDTPSSVKTIRSSRKSRSFSGHSTTNSFENPGTLLNVTKCIKKNKANVLNVQHGNTPATPNRYYSLKRRSNSTVLCSQVDNKKTEVKKPVYKSQCEIKVNKPTNPMSFSANKISGLPMSKRFSMAFKGKENVKPQ